MSAGEGWDRKAEERWALSDRMVQGLLWRPELSRKRGRGGGSKDGVKLKAEMRRKSNKGGGVSQCVCDSLD